MARSSAQAVAGSCLAAHPPAFAGDGQSVFVPCGSRVKILDATTGEAVGVLRGHSSPVTAVAASPRDAMQVYTASVDGTVRLWDVVDASCVAKWDLGAPAHFLVAPAAEPNHVYAVTASYRSFAAAQRLISAAAASSASPATLPHWSIVQLCVSDVAAAADGASPQSAGDTRTLLRRPGAVRSLSSRSLTSRLAGTALVAALGADGVLVVSTAANRATLIGTERPTTAVCVHPRGPVVAVGDSAGRVQDLRCMVDEVLLPSGGEGGPPGEEVREVRLPEADAKSMFLTTRHWHPHAVRAIAVTDDGGAMLTGGAEGVLVTWQLRASSKAFLPRLPGAVLHVAASPDGSRAVVALADNSIRCVSLGGNTMDWCVRGLAIAMAPGQLRTAQPFSPAVDPRTRALVLHGAPGSGALQFFDADRDKHVAEVEVTARSSVLVGPAGPTAHRRITHVAFSSDGQAVTTVERWAAPRKSAPRSSASASSSSSSSAAAAAAGGGGGSSAAGAAAAAHLEAEDEDAVDDGDETIKFWRFDAAKATYALSTRVDAPHKRPVTCIAYHPTRQVVATASARARAFKIWVRVARAAAPTMAGSASSAAAASAASTEAARKGAKAAAAAAAAAASSGAGAPAGGADQYVWTCRSVGFYREEPVSALSFSADGSVLLAACGSTLTLWDPVSNKLLRTLSHQPPTERVRFAALLPGRPSIVSCSSAHIFLWSALSGRVRWSYSANAVAVAVDPYTAAGSTSAAGVFAVAVRVPAAHAAAAGGARRGRKRRRAGSDPRKRAGSGAGEDSGSESEADAARAAAPRPARFRVALFSADSPTPLRVWQLSSAPLSLVFLPPQSSRAGGASAAAAAAAGRLAAVTMSREVLVLGGSEEDAAAAGGDADGVARQPARVQSAFDALFGDGALSRADAERASRAAAAAAAAADGGSVAVSEKAKAALRALESAPSHVLPPPAALFAAFADAHLLRAVAAAGGEEDGGVAEGDGVGGGAKDAGSDAAAEGRGADGEGAEWVAQDAGQVWGAAGAGVDLCAQLAAVGVGEGEEEAETRAASVAVAALAAAGGEAGRARKQQKQRKALPKRRVSSVGRRNGAAARAAADSSDSDSSSDEAAVVAATPSRRSTRRSSVSTRARRSRGKR